MTLKGEEDKLGRRTPKEEKAPTPFDVKRRGQSTGKKRRGAPKKSGGAKPKTPRTKKPVFSSPTP